MSRTVTALDPNSLAAARLGTKPRAALSLVLALAAGVLAVVVVRGATRPEPAGADPALAARPLRRAPGKAPPPPELSLARRAFPAH